MGTGADSDSGLVAPSSVADKTLATFAGVLLVLSLAVLLFGSFVRASYSGDGCGVHWPSCGGGGLLVLPTSKPMAIELLHRWSIVPLSLGSVLFLIAARRRFAAGHPVRKAALGAVLTILVSALIGAILVLARWVTRDQSAGRAVTMPLHLMNNYLLLGSLAASWYWLRGGPLPRARTEAPADAKQLRQALGWIVGSMVVLGATGALSALGKTAFDHELSFARTFAERMWMHVGPHANPLLKGGVVHPLIATSAGLLVLWMCGVVRTMRPTSEVRLWAKATVGLFLGQMALGVCNLLMSAPVPLQILHLAVALANWVALTLMAVSALGAERETQTEAAEEPAVREPATSPAFVALAPARRATWKDYIALTKPRVISLLLFTTVAGMFVAQRGAPSFWLMLAVCIGGYAAAGAANTFNMVIEVDLDESMARTSHRPTVSHVISARNALIFAWTLAVGSFVLLALAANLLAASMALCGLLCYVFVYTLWLKRRTWQNIVIGGAAGAFPPLVGYSAVSGDLSLLAWVLFAIVFLWTPVHFWALAIVIKDDYARAGVPMLPVVKGDLVTVQQIGLYTVLTALVSVVPFVQGSAGLTYLVGSTLLNLGLIVQTARLWGHVDKPHARALFKFSMAYLALFFIVVAVDQARGA